MCGPIYMHFIAGICRQAESDEIRPVRDQCESACEDQGKSDQLIGFIRGGQYLREHLNFTVCTHSMDLAHYCCYYLHFNKLLERRFLSWLSLCSPEVTQ